MWRNIAVLYYSKVVISSSAERAQKIDLHPADYSPLCALWIGKWVPAAAGKAKAGMVHSVSGCTRGVKVKLWDPLRTCAIPERLRGVFTTRRYTNPRLSLSSPIHPFTFTGLFTCTGSFRFCVALLHLWWAIRYHMGGHFLSVGPIPLGGSCN